VNNTDLNLIIYIYFRKINFRKENSFSVGWAAWESSSTFFYE